MENIMEKTMYRAFKDSLSDKRKKKTAINYFDTKISYKKLDDGIEALADALTSHGVKKGDVISACTVGTPEIAKLILAANKIGAITSMIYPTATAGEIKEIIDRTNSKLLFVIEDEKICNKINTIDSDIDTIVTIPPTNSLLAPIRLAVKSKEFFQKHKAKDVFNSEKNVIRYNEFAKKGKNTKSTEVPFEKERIALLHPTGGSTGPCKNVMITNENVNGLVLNYQESGLPFKEGEVVLDVLVPFVAYGSAMLYKSLIEGAEIVQVPLFDPKKLASQFIKYKPTHFSGVPTYFESIFNDPKIKNHTMEYCKTLAAGGDGILTKTHERINSLLEQHKSACNVLLIGYGLTENYTTVTTNLLGSYELGTVGVPLGNNHVIVVSEDNKELKDGETGQICVSGRTVAKGYYKNEEETKKTFVKHDDGKIYLHTGDLGHFIEKDGKRFLVYDGRIKNLIIRSGYKIYPQNVEEELLTNNIVKDCTIVPVYDELDKHAPKAHVILKENIDREIAKQSLLSMYDEDKGGKFPEYHKPVDIKFRDSLPLTKMRKVNRQALQIEDIISMHPYVKNCDVFTDVNSTVDYTFNIELQWDLELDEEEALNEIKKYCYKRFEEEKIKVKNIEFIIEKNKKYVDSDVLLKEARVKTL